jgi:hypothetical protein
MKIIAIISIVVLYSCHPSGNAENSMVWNKVGEMKSVGPIEHGIPVYDETSVSYNYDGKTLLNVKLNKPVVIDSADKEEGWGFFQFPKIAFNPVGKLVVQWNMATDAVDSYGKAGYQRAESPDGGKTWHPIEKTIEPAYGLKLGNGDYLQIHRPRALDVAKLTLPTAIDSGKIRPGRAFKYYRSNELPEELQGVYFYRLRAKGTKWELEHSSLYDPQAVRYTDNKLFPVMWSGDMRVDEDKTLYAGVYPGFYEDTDGKVKTSGVFFYRSNDNGKSWAIQGRIPYQPDLNIEPHADKRKVLGFTEPAFEILKDGSFICIMRTSDGILGNSPMYFTRSTDKGVTWSRPVAFTKSGVKPRIIELDNGVSVLAAGRPGVQLRFSYGGKGEQWTDPFEMLPFDTNKIKEAVTCGYPDLVVTGRDRFLIVYSDFKYKNYKGEIRKGIKVREVVVTPP